jgi:hypothetical protein
VKVQILTEAKEDLMTTVNKEERHFRAFSQLNPNETSGLMDTLKGCVHQVYGEDSATCLAVKKPVAAPQLPTIPAALKPIEVQRVVVPPPVAPATTPLQPAAATTTVTTVSTTTTATAATVVDSLTTTSPQEVKTGATAAGIALESTPKPDWA